MTRRRPGQKSVLTHGRCLDLPWPGITRPTCFALSYLSNVKGVGVRHKSGEWESERENK